MIIKFYVCVKLICKKYALRLKVILSCKTSLMSGDFVLLEVHDRSVFKRRVRIMLL